MKAYFIFIFVYFSCCVLSANSTDLSQSTQYLIYREQDTNQHYPNCTAILHDFAEYAANFTKCSITHARPVSLCTKCIDHYVNFTKTYSDLLTASFNGTSCKSLFISNDRLDGVLEYHDSILHVWEKGHCNACYKWTQNENPEPSDDTDRFKTMHNTTIQCIERYNDTKDACQQCYQDYVKLDEFYKTLSTDSIGLDSICMDIVDSMNATRYRWSKVLNCCRFRRSPEVIFLCSSAFIALLPLIFYVAVRFCGPIRDLPNVLKQSRFKQFILRSSESSDGRIN